MRRRRTNTNFIRPTFNKGRFFVGGSLKKHFKKKRKSFYGKGLFGGLLLSAVVPKILDKIL